VELLYYNCSFLLSVIISKMKYLYRVATILILSFIAVSLVEGQVSLKQGPLPTCSNAGIIESLIQKMKV